MKSTKYYYAVFKEGFYFVDFLEGSEILILSRSIEKAKRFEENTTLEIIDKISKHSSFSHVAFRYITEY